MKMAGHHKNASQDNKKRTTRDNGFFAVDVRCFAEACEDVNYGRGLSCDGVRNRRR
jgi:hypothetical protein